MLYSHIGLNSPKGSGGMFVYQLVNEEGIAVAVVYLPIDSDASDGLALCLDRSVSHRKAGILRLALMHKRRFGGTGMVGTFTPTGASSGSSVRFTWMGGKTFDSLKPFPLDKASPWEDAEEIRSTLRTRGESLCIKAYALYMRLGFVYADIGRYLLTGPERLQREATLASEGARMVRAGLFVRAAGGNAWRVSGDMVGRAPVFGSRSIPVYLTAGPNKTDPFPPKGVCPEELFSSRQDATVRKEHIDDTRFSAAAMVETVRLEAAARSMRSLLSSIINDGYIPESHVLHERVKGVLGYIATGSPALWKDAPVPPQNDSQEVS